MPVLLHNDAMLDCDKPLTQANEALAQEPGAECFSPDDLAQRATQAVAFWTDHGSAYATANGARPLPAVRLVFDLRGLNAGEFVQSQRRYGGPCIRINRELLQRYPRHMIQQVIPHEVAHYVVWAMQRRRTQPHGREWRAVMQHFDKPAEVSHRMDVRPTRRVRKHAFRCGCPTNPQYSSVILKRCLRGARYQCRRCGERLLPTEAALTAVRAMR